MTAEMQQAVAAWQAAGWGQSLTAGCCVCGQSKGEVCRRVETPMDLATLVLLPEPHPERVIAAGIAAGDDAEPVSDEVLHHVVSAAMEGLL